MDAFAERLSGADAGADQGVAFVDPAAREGHAAVSQQAAFRVLECWRPSSQPRPCGENEMRLHCGIPQILFVQHNTQCNYVKFGCTKF